MNISLVIEIIVALLLIVTISYCINLSRKLQRLKADEVVMRQIIGDLVQSTGKAEYSIRALKATAEECEHTISERLNSAKSAVAELEVGRKEARKSLKEYAELTQMIGQHSATLEKRIHLASPPHATASLEPGSLSSSALDRLRNRAA